MPVELPSNKVQTGKDEYIFVERQDEVDVSGELNYPNKLTITLNTDIAWYLFQVLVDHFRYHSDQPTVDLSIYGKLSEGDI